MGEGYWKVNLTGTNLVSFLPADVEKSLWPIQTLSLFSKDLTTVLVIYNFIFYGITGILSLFFSLADINMEEEFMGCISAIVISFFFFFLPAPMSFSADKKFWHVAHLLTNTGGLRPVTYQGWISQALQSSLRNQVYWLSVWEKQVKGSWLVMG